METITYTDARKNMAKIMNDVCENSEVKIINRTKNSAVVMISLDDYNSLMETSYLLSSPKNAARLRASIYEAKHGKTRKVKLAKV